MNKRKLGKWILIALGIAFFIFKIRCTTPSRVWNHIVEWNLEISQGKVIWLFMAYWCEILITLIVWNSLIFKISVETDFLLDEISAGLIKKKKIRTSIFCIRLNYSIGKLLFFLRLGWVLRGFKDSDEIVWNNITRPPIKDVISAVCFSLVKLPILITLFLTAISLGWIELNDVQNKLKNLSSLEFDFWEYIKLLSPLSFVVLIVFIGYFISFRGNIRRVIAQANRKRMEDIIQKQRDLIEAIGMSLYPIASNLQYVINCQDLVADLWVHSRFPNYKDEKLMPWGSSAVESYCFRDIPDLEIISQKFNELNSNGNRSVFGFFSSYKYEFLTLMVRSSLSDLKGIFFTNEGIKTLIANAGRPMVEYSEDEIYKMREDYLQHEIPKSLVKSLKLLYKLCRYYDEMNKLLNFKSDKVGRMLRMFTGKE